jgi:WD and tetratricopeptide repeat-containing protein 1
MEWDALLRRELDVSLITHPRGGNLPPGLARKLCLSGVLAGHSGCVNRLAWNQDGSMLASASDDCQVRCEWG